MEKCIALLSVILIPVTIAASEKSTHVEVRAVLINCEPDQGQSVLYDNDATTFEREELYKHSVLRDCNKKIGLTVKITTDPDYNEGDEYIPIEHVFQGSKQRVRLLNPYVLRLRREAPIQAYKLQMIDTVFGTLTQGTEFRMKRNLVSLDTSNIQNFANGSRKFSQDSVNYETLSELSLGNQRGERSLKRDSNVAEKDSQNIAKNNFAPVLDFNELMIDVTTLPTTLDSSKLEESVNLDDTTRPDDAPHLDDYYKPILDELVSLKTKKPQLFEDKIKTDWPDLDDPNTHKQLKAKQELGNKETGTNYGKEYKIYEIGNPDLWHTIQVQLFEKLTTADGKVAWNDLTKGKPARVSSLSPEWTGQDISIIYKSSEWIPRANFTLPRTRMCLLAPVSSKASVTLKPNDASDTFIVVPREDIVGLANDGHDTKKRDDNVSDLESSTKPDEMSPSRVLIRTSRALFGGVDDKVNIATHGTDQYLTMMHKQPYHAQIEVESRADGNQMVHVGSSGRLMTIVSDSSRRTRTVLTIQTTNTGLAAAQFKVIARECVPELPEMLHERVNKAANSFIILPPKHTQSILLNIPTEIPIEVVHCSVALINGNHQSVAVRDVKIRKGDRCFCVWHCECVCLGEDPKLRCREMAKARQVAAGLSVRGRSRHVRSVCYPDVISLNLCFSAFGVIAMLMFFGLVKACFGLVCRCIGAWGLSHLLQMPRKLDHYYECSLQDRPVIYDAEGWPVHPDTKERTVRVVSKPMEFILNLIFFVAAPSVLIYESLRQLFNKQPREGGTSGKLYKNGKTKNCFSSHDIQGTNTNWRRRRWRLQRWMTPEAEKLTSNVMQESLPIRASMIRDTMQPLLREDLKSGDIAGRAVSCGDSELEDTEYVLMQMQKSRESLAKSQRKLNGSVTSAAKKQ